MRRKKVSARELLRRARAGRPLPDYIMGSESVSRGVGSHGFGFIFRYGVCARNELDTFWSRYNKDMVVGARISTRMVLTDDEMERIRLKMVEIDFFSYPEVFSVCAPDEAEGIVTTYCTYCFLVKHDSTIKVLNWDDEFTNENDDADALRDLISLITTIIESKPEYKGLPEPRSAYL